MTESRRFFALILIGLALHGISLPAATPSFDLSADFSPTNNPNGAWSYGSKTTLSGVFTPFASRTQTAMDGATISIWWHPSGYPAVYWNGSSTTATASGTPFPPGTVWVYPGQFAPLNFGVIRLTVPAGAGGNYHLGVAVRSYIDGPTSGDTDFHILRNGVEIFGQFLPSGGTSFSNLLALAVGDTLDFAVGRGLDDNLYASALKVAASLTFESADAVAPTILTQPQSKTVVSGGDVTFTVGADGTPPLSYQWLLNNVEIDGATGSSLTFNNIQPTNAGTYSVRVSNAQDSVLSSNAVLVVTAGATYDLSRDFSAANNPNGVWSYGYKTDLSGAFTPFADKTQTSMGTLINIWWHPVGYPAVWWNGSSGTGVGDAGTLYPPGTVWVYPGQSAPLNFGVIRLTIPAGAGGNYHLGAAVRSYIDGPTSGDNEIHFLKNGIEIFGQFLPKDSGTSYSNSLALAAGDTLDFAVGRGLDNSLYATALKIAVSLTFESTDAVAPTILTQPQSKTVVSGGDVTFTVGADGTPPLSYQWLFNNVEIDGATRSSLTLSNVQSTNSGNYSVRVSNAQDSVLSSNAVLVVAAGATYDLSRDFSAANNPNGVWSYGYKTDLSGAFTPFADKTQTSMGTLINIWWHPFGYPAVYWNGSSGTGVGDAGTLYPPGTVWVYPGQSAPLNFGVIRLTIPAGAGGNYHLGAAVRSYIDGPTSGDNEIHLLKNDIEIFGQFLPKDSGTSYSNSLALAAGDTLDFAVGRGLDNSLFASALKIAASLTFENADPVAPTILTQPQSKTVVSGGDVTFTVGADGTPPLSYQWLFNNVEIDGATSSSLTLNNVQPTNSGNYSVRVSNAQDSVLSSNAVLELVVVAGPTYDLSRDFSAANNPNGVWSYGYKTDLSGAFTAFTNKTQTFIGSALINIWWHPSGYPGVWWNGSSETAVGDANTPFPPGTVWVYPGQSAPLNFGVIRLTIPAGAGGNYHLGAAVRSYIDGPTSGDTDFHILKNGVEIFGQFLPGGGTSFSNSVSLAGGDTLDFAVGRGLDNNLYASALKIAASLAFENADAVAPTILAQPQSQTVVSGGDATFTVGADGTPPLSYQWLFNNVGIDGATSSSLTLNNIQPTNSGTYSVRVSNSQDSVLSSNAELVVVAGPTYDLSRDFSTTNNPNGVWSYGYKTDLGGDLTPFTAKTQAYMGNALINIWWHPSGYPAVYRNGSSFTAAAENTLYPPGTVWFYPGQSAPLNFGAIRFTVPPGVGGTYHFATAVRSYIDGPTSHDADFHVVANGAELFGQFLPGNSSTTYSKDLFLAAGDSVDFLVGRGEDNNLFGSGLKVNIAVYLVSTNESAPIIEKQPENTIVLLGATATFGVVAGGTAPLGYQWLKNDEEISGANGPQLILADADPADEGAYKVRVSNTIGTNLSDAVTLTVNVVPIAPFITFLSQSLTAAVGSNVALSVVAGGTVPLSYQWRLNDIDIPDAHDSSLSLPNAQVTNSGAYRVFISNTAGNKLSDPINVTVIVPPALPVITAQPAGQSVSLGQNVTLSVTATGELLHYQWRFNNTDIPNATSTSLSITNAQVENSGDYSVVVSNPAGPVPSDTAHLTVHVDRTLALQDPPDAHEGDLISVPLLLASTGDVGGLSFSVNFNPDVLSAPEIVWDSSLDTALEEINVTAGLLQGIFVLPATAVPAGTQQLATIHFRARTVPADSASLLNLQVTDLSDTAGDPVLYGTKIVSANAHILASASGGLAGDNNGNGQVDVGDASLLLRLLAHLDSIRPIDVTRNDFNHNGVLDSGDAIKILRIVAGIDTPPQAPLTLTSSKKSSAATSSAALAVAESLSLEPDGLQGTACELVTVRVKINNLAGPISGAKFTVDYPVTALRLRNQQDLRVGPSISPQALAVWNVAPAQNNFATQNGHVTLALGSANAWTLSNSVLAELTFEVQAGASAQYLWPITVTGGQCTTDGYSPRSLADGQMNFIGRDQAAATFSGLTHQASGQFQFTLSGDVGANYIVEKSDDLVTWSLVTNISNSPASIPVTDSDALGHPQRFYRARPAQ